MSASTFSGGLERDFMVPGLPFRSGMPTATAGDAMAPLIFNAWYVVAESTDVDRSLGRIKALGQPLVYYRTENGLAVVLDDRCAHRRFPLSKGQLIGDRIQCGYHGFTYESSGQCVWAPVLSVTDERNKKLTFGVRAYPCAERGPWLWVWMGAPERADPDLIPLPALELAGRPAVSGNKMNPSNYWS